MLDCCVTITWRTYMLLSSGAIQCIYISSSIISSVSDLHTFYRLLAVLEMEFQISFLFGLIPPVKIFSYLWQKVVDLSHWCITCFNNREILICLKISDSFNVLDVYIIFKEIIFFNIPALSAWSQKAQNIKNLKNFRKMGLK